MQKRADKIKYYKALKERLIRESRSDCCALQCPQCPRFARQTFTADIIMY